MLFGLAPSSCPSSGRLRPGPAERSKQLEKSFAANVKAQLSIWLPWLKVEVGTGVPERVIREMNRRTDVGVRWSIEGVRAILMIKCDRKYHQGRWSSDEGTTDQPKVRFSLVS